MLNLVKFNIEGQSLKWIAVEFNAMAISFMEEFDRDGLDYVEKKHCQVTIYLRTMTRLFTGQIRTSELDEMLSYQHIKGSRDNVVQVPMIDLLLDSQFEMSSQEIGVLTASLRLTDYEWDIEQYQFHFKNGISSKLFELRPNFKSTITLEPLFSF